MAAVREKKEEILKGILKGDRIPLCYAASKLPQKPASEGRGHSVHDTKGKGI